jgi:hypothetical protein
VVANRILPAPFTVAGESSFDKMRSDPELLGLADTNVARQLISGVALAEDLRHMRTDQLRRLRDGLAERSVANLPIALIPELFEVGAGLPMTRAMATQLTDELGL